MLYTLHFILVLTQFKDARMEKSVYVSGRVLQYLQMLILRDRDYRGLKKRITVIRKAQPNQRFHILPSDDSPDEDASPLSSDLDEAMKKANAIPVSPGKGQDVQAIATQSRTSEHSRTSLEERDSISVKKASIDHPATTQNLKNADKVTSLPGIRRGRSFLTRRELLKSCLKCH